MIFIVKKDYYKILGVGSNATAEEIKAAYRKVAKEFHPDLYPNNPLVKLADERLKEINEAYEILCDEEKRKEYDNAKIDKHHEYTTHSNKQESDNNKNTDRKKHSKHNSYNEDKNHRKKTSRNSHASYEKEQGPIAPCHIHHDKPGIDKCSICGAYLCEDCANIFDVLMCPECLSLNNDMYIKALKMPPIYAASSFLIGAGIGTLVGIQQNVLNDYGVLEGLAFGVYIMAVCLYILYISMPIYKFFFQVFKIFFYVFDLNINTVSTLANLVTLLIGVTVGWMLGLFWGIIRLRKDYVIYYKYKPEYLKTKEFIKEKYGI